MHSSSGVAICMITLNISDNQGGMSTQMRFSQPQPQQPQQTRINQRPLVIQVVIFFYN